MVQRQSLLAIACLAGLAGSASAGLIDVTITGAISQTSLDLGSPRTWVRGTDWDTAVTSATTGDSWAREKWVGMAPVNLNVNVTSDGDPDVKITKMLTNTTGTAWTSFRIKLLDVFSVGPITVLPGTELSDRFHSVTTSVIPGGLGSSEMVFSQTGADTPVLPGESVMFQFTFNVPSAVAFAMVQTPVPTPGVLAVAGLAGVVVTRRRR